MLSDWLDGITVYAVGYNIDGATEYLSRFTVDGVIFAVILVFAIVFEKGVLTVEMSPKTA